MVAGHRSSSGEARDAWKRRRRSRRCRSRRSSRSAPARRWRVPRGVRDCGRRAARRRDGDHAGAVGIGSRVGVRGLARGGESSGRQLAPDRHAANRQAAAVVRLHQHADGPGVVLLLHASGRGADVAFPAERDRSGAGADRALIDGALARGGDRRGDVVASDVKAADVVQAAVVGFANQRVDGPDFSLPGCASVHLTTASTATPTPSVLVSTIGDSIVPSSCTCVEPANLPKALPTNTAPGTFSRNRLPPCGPIAVTPVRTVSPAMRVACPTCTPGTSVMAFSGPGLPSPGVIPGRAPAGVLGRSSLQLPEERPRQRRPSGRLTRRKGTSSHST